jgi:hypothetical protein
MTDFPPRLALPPRGVEGVVGALDVAVNGEP